jgi:hypothetical protein
MRWKMAHIRDNCSQPFRAELRSKSGSVYIAQTDVNGVISCSCLGWLMLQLPIEQRVCKHLAEALGIPQTKKADVDKAKKDGKAYKPSKAKIPRRTASILKDDASAPASSLADYDAEIMRLIAEKNRLIKPDEKPEVKRQIILSDDDE